MQVHRVVRVTNDFDSSWGEHSPTVFTDAPLAGAGSGKGGPAGCLDTRSTSVLIEAASSAGSQPMAARRAAATAEAKESEWKCARTSCGRMNAEEMDHCAFCATVRGSSGARGEMSSVYLRR